MSCYGKALFFVVHCVLHFVAYLLPRAVRHLWGLLCCCCCRSCESPEDRQRREYIYRPEADVKVIHHFERLEVLENVFGLFDVRQSRREDKQYCVEDYYLEELKSCLATGPRADAEGGGDVMPAVGPSEELRVAQGQQQLAPGHPTWSIHCPHGLPSYAEMKRDIASEKERLRVLKKRHLLRYSSPLYTGHIGTIMGAFRPADPIVYSRERFTAWDGCPVYLDWLYVEGEEPQAFLTATAAEAVRARRERRRSVKRGGKGKAGEGGCVDVVDRPSACTAEPIHTGAAAAAVERHPRHPDPQSGHPPDRSGAFDREEGVFEVEVNERAIPAVVGGTCDRPSLGAGPYIPGEYTDTGLPPRSTGAGEGGGSSSGSSRRSIDDDEGRKDVTPTRGAGDCDGSGKTHTHAVNDGVTARGVVLVLPGLTSHSQSNYVQRLVRALHRARYHVCVLNTRGMGPDMELGEHNNFLFNGAYTRDVRDVVQNVLSRENVLRRFFPQLFDPARRPASNAEPNYAVGLPVLGIGLSIGGAILSKYLGEEGMAGRDCCLDAALTVCPPNDFVKMVEHMNRGTYQKSVYQRDMCADVRNYILRHPPLQRLPNVDNDWVFASVNGELEAFRNLVRSHDAATRGCRGVAPPTTNPCETPQASRPLGGGEPTEEGSMNIDNFTRVIHFDEHVIARSAGYRSIHHYHHDTSAVRWLPYTPIPLLVLSTFDDPVIGRTVLGHRWREIINGNSYLPEQAAARRVSGETVHPPRRDGGTPGSWNGSSSSTGAPHSHPHSCNCLGGAEANVAERQRALVSDRDDQVLNYYASASTVPPHGGAGDRGVGLAAHPAGPPQVPSLDGGRLAGVSERQAAELLQHSIQNNKNVVYCESHCGGHLGFLGGPVDELIGREDYMQRFVLQRLLAASDFYFTHVLRIRPPPARGCSGSLAPSTRSAPCAAAQRRTRVEEVRHLEGIMRPPYALHDLRSAHAVGRRGRDGGAVGAGEVASPSPCTGATRTECSGSLPLTVAAAVGVRVSSPSDSTANEVSWSAARNTAMHRAPSMFAKLAAFTALTDPNYPSKGGVGGGRASGELRRVPALLAKTPVPPPLHRRSNKCYFTHKTLYPTEQGNDQRTFYTTLFIDDDEQEAGGCGGAAGVEPLCGDGPAVGEDSESSPTLTTGGGSRLPYAHPASMRAPPLGEDLNMARVQRQNERRGNTTHTMSTDVLDLMTMRRCPPPPLPVHRHEETSAGATPCAPYGSQQFPDSPPCGAGGGVCGTGDSTESDPLGGDKDGSVHFCFHGYLLNWMDTTGPYRPIRVNCDYAVDPRTCMRADL